MKPIVAAFAVLLAMSLSLDAKAAPTCAPDNVQSGDATNFVFADGTACVSRPIREAWAVLNNASLMTWEGASYENSQPVTPPAGVLFTYAVKYTAGWGFVDWTMHWHNMLKQGTSADPRELDIQYVKVSGTSHIPYWKGDVHLTYVDPGTTAVSVHNEVKADQTDAGDAASTIKTIFQKLRTGAPNWNAINGH